MTHAASSISAVQQLYLDGFNQSQISRMTGINRTSVGEWIRRGRFSNASPDIRRIYCDACTMLGIEWRQMTMRDISVAKRKFVLLMDSFIGPKA